MYPMMHNCQHPSVQVYEVTLKFNLHTSPNLPPDLFCIHHVGANVIAQFLVGIFGTQSCSMCLYYEAKIATLANAQDFQRHLEESAPNWNLVLVAVCLYHYLTHYHWFAPMNKDHATITCNR